MTSMADPVAQNLLSHSQASAQVLGGGVPTSFYGDHQQQQHAVMGDVDHHLLMNNIHGCANYNYVWSNMAASNSSSTNSDSDLANNINCGGLSLGIHHTNNTNTNTVDRPGPNTTTASATPARMPSNKDVEAAVSSSSDNNKRYNPPHHKQDEAGSWLQLALATTTQTQPQPDDESTIAHHHIRLPPSTSYAPSPGFRYLELHLAPSPPHNHLPPTFLSPNSHHHHLLRPGGSPSSVSPSASSSSPSLMQTWPTVEAPGPGHTSDFRIIHPPPRRPHSGVWFMLQASHHQAREPFLPQLPKSFLRIKDGRMTVRLVMKYVANKFGLDSESEVEIKCRGEVLVPFLTLQHVRDRIWSPRNRDVDAAAATVTWQWLPNSPQSHPHLMLLHYGRVGAATPTPALTISSTYA